MGKIIIEAGTRQELTEILKDMGYVLASAASPLTMQSGPAPQPEEDDAPPTPGAPIPDRDSSGLPWDDRIHAKSKALNSDGTWRKKRNVQDSLVTQVEAELRAAPVGAAPGPTYTPPPAPQPAPAPAPMPQSTPSYDASAFAPPQPAAPVTAPAPAPTMDGNQFLAKLGQLMAMDNPVTGQKYVDSAYVQVICQWLQITEIMAVLTRPDLIPHIVNRMQTEGRWIN